MDFLPGWPPEFNTQIAFGMLLIFGVLGGYLAHRISWLPSITGFMAVGLAIGPSGLNLLSSEALGMTRPLIDVALGLILYRLGLSLDLRRLLHDRRTLLLGLVESTATFLACFFLLNWLGLPTLVSGLTAAIVISSSPAVLIHVAHEVGAAGPVTERGKELVALNNLFSFFAFSALLPAGYLAVDAGWMKALLQPIYQLLGSMVVALAIAAILVLVARKTRSAAQYRLALIIGALMLGVGIADALNLSVLFVPLAIGIVVRSLEREDPISDVAFGEAFELFFVVLFVYAGAKIDLGELGSVGWVAILLVPMAGLAIGLAQTADTLFALEAVQLNALILAAVAILETIGPPIAAYAFRVAGETGKIPASTG